MLRLAGSRQAEVAARANANHPCGDAPRPQREREPLLCAASGCPLVGSRAAQNRGFWRSASETAYDCRPRIVDVTDQQPEAALARSFLAGLPPEVTRELQAEGERADYPAGTTVYRPGSPPQAALVVGGLIRVYLTSPEGRQVTVRYARPGDVLGIAVLVGGPAGTGVQAVEPSSLFRISARVLTAAARRDPRVSWAIAEELNRRLYEVLEQTAVNAFGSVRQRVAAHLLDLASTGQRPDRRLVARVSQQELADAAGSVREVVARVLRDFRVAGIVATAADQVVILDAARLYAESAGPAGL
jgi:CRP/FNR family transcriptional regulator, cyclic AMP receptor protein